MSEQLAKRMGEREEIEKHSSKVGNCHEGPFSEVAEADTFPDKVVSDCSDDLLIAQMLQVQFDQARV